MEDRKPFEPLDGVTPRWKKLHDLVTTRKVGEEITYREAMEVLDLDPYDRNSRKLAQDAMREAQRHLENQGLLTVGTIAKFGWVVLDPQRELDQTERRQVKTRKSAGKTLRGAKALNTRRDQLSQFERQRLDFTASAARIASQATGRNGLTLEGFKKIIESGEKR